MTQRSGFVLHVRPDRIDEYVRRTPGMAGDARTRSGTPGSATTRSSAEATDVFGYFEADDLEAAAAHHRGTAEVSARWQDAMAGLLEQRVPDGGPASLEQIFRLD